VKDEFDPSCALDLDRLDVLPPSTNRKIKLR
jgi:hypothetical protein